MQLVEKPFSSEWRPLQKAAEPEICKSPAAAPVITSCYLFIIRGLWSKPYRCVFPKGWLGVISEYALGSLTLALQWYVNACFWRLAWNFLTSIKKPLVKRGSTPLPIPDLH